MTDTNPDRQAAFRATITTFLHGRRDTKRDKLATDDPKYEMLMEQFSWVNWIDNAAKRVTQIQAVTHSLKAIHPDARGTNLYCHPKQLFHHAEVGSHVLGENFAGDVVGNAAALDVYKLLGLSVDGQSLLDWMLADDADLKAALSDDPVQAENWIKAFTTLVHPRSGMASHTRAKQLYWLTGDDPCEDSDYHILAPLYASSLAHAVFQTINHDRFSEETKAARKARWNNEDHDTGYAEYPDLAVQKLGGTKPQNISQLNSERGGNNYLLSSLPPQWQTSAIRLPWHVDSIFPTFGAQKSVRELVRGLRQFLESQPEPTLETRNRIEEITDTLIDELVGYARSLQDTSEWTLDDRCELVDVEQLWLDPGRTHRDDEFRMRWQQLDWPIEIGRRFGNWLNQRLDGQLPLGEIQQRHWAKELLLDDDWARTLKKQRDQLNISAKHVAGDML